MHVKLLFCDQVHYLTFIHFMTTVAVLVYCGGGGGGFCGTIINKSKQHNYYKINLNYYNIVEDCQTPFYVNFGLHIQ